jgi:hypothetical protein
MSTTMFDARSPCKLLIVWFLATQHSHCATAKLMGEHGHFHAETSEESILVKPQDRIEFACPSAVPKAANADENQKEWYDATSAEIAQNVTKFLSTFREKEEYDNWSHSYEQVKAKYVSFKAKYFAPNLSSGMSIYESASGIGLNLLMTLEFLEQQNVKEIIVYGNEYVHDSVEVSKQILGSHLLPGNAKVGQFCQADSSDLRHVPSDSFDLVYTGYITPMMNPLHFDMDRHEIHKAYEALCQTLEEDTAEQAREKTMMSRRAQTLQNDWYRAWVEEMIRIAKPGAPVIIEQVSYSKCESINDWGGVDRSFWTENNFEWDIDPDSIAFEQEDVFGSRYHVFMRKNSHTMEAHIA